MHYVTLSDVLTRPETVERYNFKKLYTLKRIEDKFARFLTPPSNLSTDTCNVRGVMEHGFCRGNYIQWLPRESTT
jgi:hypothetical protein